MLCPERARNTHVEATLHLSVPAQVANVAQEPKSAQLSSVSFLSSPKRGATPLIMAATTRKLTLDSCADLGSCATFATWAGTERCNVAST